ncbi:MAG TPA: tetratricopeptide repeat protein [Bacteroidales bacterium]|nr:tetratricopeptide repeat protein [Bacteroidales bacterium]HSA42674.1 tetratricopeptide repeat protein [Bacteroidales bacterium]
MKKHLILLALALGMVSFAWSQSTEVQNAYREWNKGKLDKAKASIDKAAAYESTMTDPKTWLYRGSIYYDLSISKVPAYQGLHPDPLNESYESFRKALQFDTKKKYEEELIPRMLAVGEMFFNRGVWAYENGEKSQDKNEFAKAASLFETSLQINEGFGKIDTLAMYNIAFVSQKAGDNLKALQYYQKLLNLGYKKANVYVSISNVYKALSDTSMALRMASDGRNLFKENLDLLITETNLYLAMKDMDKAKKNLYNAMEMDPTNPTIYFAVGTLWDSTGNFKEAENAYKRAIDIQADYFDAIYNLGILYFNTGVNIFKAADAIMDMNLYAKEKEKYDAMWNQAIPYLEKALELRADDIQTMYALKQIYARLNMEEKRKGIEEKLHQFEQK